MRSKYCTGCSKSKPTSEYWSDATHSDGLQSRCNSCMRAYGKGYRSTKHGKDKNYEPGIKRRFGMTIEDYDRMFEEQNGVCAICGRAEVRTYKGVQTRLAVDHDHRTGKVRQLLCYRCNSILGFADDSIGLLSKCIKYLTKH